MSTTLRIRYEGEFDFQGLYDLISDFFRRRNYDFFETNMKQKDATPAGKEILLRFKPEKNINEYVKFTYDIQWKCADAAETADGTTFARMHVYVTYDVDLDWQGYEKSRPWLKKIYEDYIIDMDIDEIHRQEIGIEAQTLIDSINEFLGTVV